MSTLRTRIAGYPFAIVTHADGSAEGGFIGNALPFELRSTYSQREGQTLPILLAAHEAMVELRERFYRGEPHYLTDAEYRNMVERGDRNRY